MKDNIVIPIELINYIVLVGGEIKILKSNKIEISKISIDNYPTLSLLMKSGLCQSNKIDFRVESKTDSNYSTVVLEFPTFDGILKEEFIHDSFKMDLAN